MNIQDFLDLFNPTFDGIVIGLLIIIVAALTWRLWVPFILGGWEAIKREESDIEDTVDTHKEGRPKS